MEIVLLIIAGVVLYFLYNSFQDYMKNPYNKNEQVENESFKAEYNIQNTPYKIQTTDEKIAKTEFGILAKILHCLSSADGKICELEQEMIKNMLDDIALELSDYPSARKDLQKIFDENKENIDVLAQNFANETKGEYKKRLKVIEFLFALAYADGTLSDNEREMIIDCAALFELDNDDFNKLYDEFEMMYKNDVEMDKARALEILELDSNYNREQLEQNYKQKIKEKKQNILLNKNLNKNFMDNSAKFLREIDAAYEILKNDCEPKD